MTQESSAPLGDGVPSLSIPLESLMKPPDPDARAPTTPEDTTPETPEFVSSTTSVHRVLKRLHESEGTLVFATESGDMKIVLRSDSDPDEPDAGMLFDMGFLVSESLVEMEQDGSFDESGVYVTQIVSITGDSEAEDLELVKELLNDAYRAKICECGERIIWDGHSVCTLCDLVRDGETSTGSTCIICSEPILTRRGQVTMSCCNQHLHKLCRNKYEESSKKSCPVCRT